MNEPDFGWTDTDTDDPNAVSRTLDGMACSLKDDGWQSFDVVRRFIEQSQPDGYAYLPERLSRDQAQPLCVLEGSCERSGQCYGDCDCNPGAQVAWTELRTQLLAAAPKPEKSPNGYQEQIGSAKRTMQDWPEWMKRTREQRFRRRNNID